MAIKVRVGTVHMSMPERVTIDEWIKMMTWDFELPEHHPYIIHDLLGIDLEDLKNADQPSLDLFIGFIVACINKRTLKKQPDFNKLNFGEFVDLDSFLALGTEKHIKDMMKVLDYDTPWADEALMVLDKYIQWRSTIYKQYSQLFGLDGPELSDTAKEDFDPKDTARGWYNVIVDLANDDILKMDLVTEEPLHKTLTFLQIKKEKAIKEQQQLRKMSKSK
tara:strand:+ start:260 stop:919 length:660 start_codon:yes stop_codon:yes gene_type:complete